MGLLGLTSKQWGRILQGFGAGVSDVGTRLGRKKELEEQQKFDLEREETRQAARRAERADDRDRDLRQRELDREAVRLEKRAARREEADLTEKRYDYLGKEAEAKRIAERRKETEKLMQDPQHLALLFSQGKYTPTTPMELGLLEGILGKKAGTEKPKGASGKEFQDVWEEFQKAHQAWSSQLITSSRGPEPKFETFLQKRSEARKAYEKLFGPIDGNETAPVETTSRGNLTDWMRLATAEPGQVIPTPPTSGKPHVDTYNYYVLQPQPGASGALNPADFLPAVESGGGALGPGGVAVGATGDAIDITPIVDPGYYANPEQDENAKTADSLMLALDAGQQITSEQQAWLDQYLAGLEQIGLIGGGIN